MPLDADRCYLALRARDPRFDGVFFVAVTTTGVYCRPICPARLPGRDRCRFFPQAAEAERAGFRACLRCRPELAPGHGAVDSVPRLVRAALRRIDEGFLNERSLEELARSLGVSGRHLRRAIFSQLGVTPIELSQSRRLALGKQLLQDTALPLSQVAFAAGFASVRRFDALFSARFGRPPSALRRDGGEAADPDVLALRLDYRPPLDWPALLSFLKERAIPGVEAVADGAYHRTVAQGGHSGWLRVRPAKARAALVAELPLSLSARLPPILSRLRALFDLDAMPRAIDEQLRKDPLLRPLCERHPGLRVPGAFDGFETAVRAVLGQQISVAAATTLAGRLAARFGRPLPAPPKETGLLCLFPSAKVLARISEAELAAIGLPGARARTIIALAQAVSSGHIDLSSAAAAPEDALPALLSLPGIGPWTAHYIAMRALSWPDAFPAGDLGIHRALGVTSPRAAEARAEAFRPFRAYAVLHLWTSLSQGG